MRVTVVWSSANYDGLTSEAVKQFVKGLSESGTEVETVWLNRLHLEHCRACGNGWGGCRQKGECVLQDNFSEVYRKLTDSDGIVLATAVYWSDMTECMKSFIDRLRRCEAVKNHYLAEKRCVLIANAGGTGRGTLECLHQMELALTHMNMRAYDRIPLNRYNSAYMLPALEEAGKVYAERLTDGFDMYY